MSVAYVPSLQHEPERPYTLQLSAEERATVLSALLAHSVMLFSASDRQDFAGRADAAADLYRDGYVLSRVELRLRAAT